MLQQEFGKSVILVGDPLQQIYSWRGAIDAMLRVDCEEFALTNSFRFGKRVAWLANRMLGAYSMIRNPVVGVAPWQDVLYPLRIPHKPEAGETHVVLTRTNVTAFTEMLRLVNEGEHVAFNGEAGTFMGMVLDIYNLKQGRHDRISERGRIKSMRSYEDFVDICAVDSELNSLNGVVEHFGHDIPEVVQTLKDSLIADVRFATVTVSTVHRFKGLEADFVSLADDFPEMTRDGKILPIRCGVWEKASNCVNREDLHLQYVAITRAKKFLAIPKTMTDLLDVLRDNPRPEFYIPSADEPSMGSAQGEASRRVSIEDLFQ
jgi:superfamily I DNA/RNA helicase